MNIQKTKYLSLLGFNFILLPLYFSVYILAFILTLLPIFPTRIGISNLTQRLSKSRLRAHFDLAVIYLNYFIYFIEATLFWYTRTLSVKNEKETIDFFSSMFAKYKVDQKLGFIILSAHFGNIEMLGTFTTRILKNNFSHPCFALAKPPKIKLAAILMDIYRASREIETVSSNNPKLFEYLKTINDQGVSVGFLLDQKPKRNGIFVEFMGKYSAFPYRGIEPLINAKLPVIHAATQRIFPGYFKIIFAEGNNEHIHHSFTPETYLGNSPVTKAKISENIDAKITEELASVVAGYVGWLENIVKKHPLQWFWDYNKWSRNISPKESND